MTDYKAALEALDMKAGRVHTVDDWRRVGEKSQRAPETLTDGDITILGFFDGGQSAASARARRAKALAPPSPQPPAETPQPKAAPMGVSGKKLRKYFDAYTNALVPVLKDAFDQRDAKLNFEIEALRIRNAELETRILELEAKDAERVVPHE